MRSREHLIAARALACAPVSYHSESKMRDNPCPTPVSRLSLVLPERRSSENTRILPFAFELYLSTVSSTTSGSMECC